MMSNEGVFVGRQDELARLRDCTSDVSDGRPWVALLEGDAGIGKSELLRRWLAGSLLNDFIVLQARCDASEQDVVFGVVQQLISPVSASILEDFPLLKGPVPTAAAPFEVGRQLLGLLGALQADRPVAVVMEDLHWADTSSLQAWGFVLRRLDADSVLTVCTARPIGSETNPDPGEAMRRLLDSAKNRLRLPLQGLDTKHVAELIQQDTGHQVRTEIAEQLRRHTDGNPLYVHTVLSQLSAADLSGGSAVALPVPASLTTAIRSRLLGLPDASRALVEAAAVLGTPVPLALLAEMAEVDSPDPAVGEALAARLLKWQPNKPSRPVEVGHSLQQQAIVESVPPDRLRHLHMKAASLVDRRAAWAHRVAAVESTDVALAAELVVAADEEFAAGEAERSATLLLWASDLEVRRSARERHLLMAAARLATFNRFTRVASLLPRVRACAPCAMRSLVLGADALFRGTLSAAEDLFAAALTESEREEDGWTRLMSQVWISGVRNFLGRHEKGAEAARQALETVPSLPWARGNLSTSLGLAEGPRAALRELTQVTPAVAQAAPLGQPVHAFLLTLQGWFRIQAGALRAGVEDCAAALAFSRSLGAPAFPDFAYVATAAAQYLLGDWDRVPLNVEHALEATSNGDGMAASYPLEHAVSTWIAAGRGEWEQAEGCLRATEHWTRFVGGEQARTWTAMSRAILAQARGDYRAMGETLEPLVRAEAGWPRLDQVFWLPMHAESLIGRGRIADAAAAISRLHAAAQEAPCLRTAAAWLSGWLAETRGDLSEARRIYEREIHRRPEEDVVLLQRAMLEHAYGRVLHASASPTHARQWFDRGRQRMQALQATPFLNRCAAEVPASSRAPARRRTSSPLELTGRERDIALLIGRGLTNKEIANELFVSSKTVEYHLGHIYGKLSLANRRELRNHVQQWGVGADIAGAAH